MVVANKNCPRCASLLLSNGVEPTCVRCGWHDWSQTPINLELFRSRGYSRFEYERRPEIYDLREPRHLNVPRREDTELHVWHWQGKNAGPLEITWGLVERAVPRDRWPAEAVEVKGVWPFSVDSEGASVQRVRTAFHRENGKMLYGLTRALRAMVTRRAE